MSCFTEEDMRTYMSDLGHTATVIDIGPTSELHFLNQLINELKSSGGATLLTQYAPLCTMVKRGDKVVPQVQQRLVEVTILAVRTVHDEINTVKDKLEDLSSSKSKYFQQVLGTVMWLVYTVMEEFNYFALVSNRITGPEKKGRGKSSFTPKDNPFTFWRNKKQTLLQTLKPLLELNLMSIFNANMNLVNKRVFYELILRSLTNIKQESKDIEILHDLLLDIFTHYISELNMEELLIHELMFNIVQSDEQARGVSKILIGLKAEKNLPNVIKKSVIRAVEIVNSPEYRDSIDKGFAIFLGELGTNFPEEMKAGCLPFVLPFAESPVVPVRNAVLVILAEVVLYQKNHSIDTKEASESDLKLRNKLLAIIEDFICDVNSAIRSKAVGQLAKALDHGGLTIDEILKISTEVADRLLDSAVSTRKNAFHFFGTLMNKEVSLAKFTPSELHEAAIKKRQEFLEARIRFIPKDKLESRVNVSIKEFTDHITTPYIAKTIANRPLPSAMNSAEKAVEHIDKLIKEHKIWDACECFYRATIEFADDGVFQNFHKTYTYDFYRAYIGRELGFDLTNRQDEPMEEDDEMNRTASEVLESDESANMREVLHHWHVLGILSELIAEAVIPTVLTLMEKGTSTDQVEALTFFGKLALYGYKLPSSVEIQILENVRGLSKSISGSILEPFSLIYLGGAEADTPVGFIKALIDLCDRLGLAGRDHISILLQDMIAAKKLHVNELKILWDIVSLRVPNMAEKESKVALYILYVCAKTDRALVQSLYEPLLEVALGPRGFQDMDFVHQALLIIAEYIGQENKAKETGIQAVRLPPDNEIFTKIFDLIKYCLHPDTRDTVNEHFTDVVELGISIIYNFSQAPTAMINKIVEQSFQWFFGKSSVECQEAEEAGHGMFEFELEEKEMLRVMVFGSAITAQHSSYHIRTVLEEVKKRKTLQKIDKIDSTPTKRRLRRSFVENSRRKSLGTTMTLSRLEITSVTEIEDSVLKAENDELEQVVGQIGFDKEIDVLKNFMESLLDDGVIAFYWKFVQHVCRRYKKLQSSRLRITTLRLFAQCMLVGTKAVTTGMELFIKIWQITKNPKEKMEMILMAILLNDCFPNVMQQHNSLIISDLSSEHKQVRLMVLDFVIYLTQSDVLKLRDILQETIMCLADESEEIREVTKNFLRECQEKDTMLHTSIPDLIFRTSTNENVPRQKFQAVMRELLAPFKKTLELVGIVEKLVDRFGTIGLEDKSAEDTAYCLSLLPFGDRTFKIIVDRVSMYEKYMRNDFIHNCFLKIGESAKENSKMDGKKSGSIEKFEERLKVAKDKFTHSTGSLEKVRF